MKYTALTGLDYEKPEEKPPAVHPDIDKDTTEEEKAELKAEQAETIEAWWARLGWIEGTGYNIRVALDKKIPPAASTYTHPVQKDQTQGIS